MPQRVKVGDRIKSPIASAVTAFTTHDETDNVNNNVKNTVSNDDTKSVEKHGIKNGTKKETVITQIKSIKIGSSVFKSAYCSNDKVRRSAYFLREDTISKIEKCSKLSTLKKAEFVDLILNDVLTEILNKLDK